MRKQVERLRLVTGMEHINPHTFRHLAITELLERGASEQTVVQIAGWSSPRMFATYSHARLEAKMAALRLLGPGGSPPDPFTPQGMSADMQDEIARQVTMALERERIPGKGGRVIRFPGAG